MRSPLATGSDGSAWFSAGVRAVDGLRIGRLLPSGELRFYVLRTGGRQSQPTSMAATSDGSVWFTSRRHGWRLVRLDSHGQFKTYGVPADSEDLKITSAGGLLWLGGYVGTGNHPEMWRAGLGGRVEVVAGTGGAEGLIAGPDDAVWAGGNGALTRLDTTDLSVRVVRYASGGSGGSTAIAAGPQGTVWAARDSPGRAARIYRIVAATGEVLKTFTLPAIPGRPDWVSSMTAGPDGNMWFAAGSVVGRITPSGAVSFFRYPTSNLPWGARQTVAVTATGRGTMVFTVGTVLNSTVSMIGEMSTRGKVLATHGIPHRDCPNFLHCPPVTP